MCVMLVTGKVLPNIVLSVCYVGYLDRVCGNPIFDLSVLSRFGFGQATFFNLFVRGQVENIGKYSNILKQRSVVYNCLVKDSCTHIVQYSDSGSFAWDLEIDPLL